ncbi:hypothetical protein IWZ00DRAFT_360450 [Phyllosticta capitalensis]
MKRRTETGGPVHLAPLLLLGICMPLPASCCVPWDGNYGVTSKEQRNGLRMSKIRCAGVADHCCHIEICYFI